MSFKFNPFTGELDIAADTTWGQITGTLSDQVDLQTALDGKADVVHTHVAADITDFDTEVSNNTDVAANTAARHSHANKALLDTYTQTEVDLADAVSKKHTQNSDTKLDDGQANEVTAADLRIHLDDITTNPHQVDIGNIGSGTLAELNLAITDATLDDAGDSRTPTGSAGGELSGTYPNPTVNDGADGSAIHDNVAGEISAIALKPIPALLDVIIIEDSEDSFNKKKIDLQEIVGLVLDKARFFLPNTNSSAAKGDYTVAAIGANASLNLTFHVPADFVTLVSLKVFFIANGNVVAETIDLNSDYGLLGQVLDFNSESDLGSALNASTDTIEEKDISSVFSSLLPNHICGLTWKNNSVGTGINILGIELRYA